MPTAREPLFECQECGKKFYTEKAAERASFGDHGCPGCGGSDIDIYVGRKGKNVGKFGGKIILSKQPLAQKTEYIEHLSKKPIKELWDKQALIKAQQRFTYNQYTHALKQKAWKNAERLEQISIELTEMEHRLKEAIGRK
jgi:hypothetical protein